MARMKDHILEIAVNAAVVIAIIGSLLNAHAG